MKRVLEIGCGQGFNSYVLAKKKENEVVGIDLSKEDIKVARERYSHIKFLQMNCEKMSLENNYFDEVYAYDVLEHVDNLQKTISEVRRVLKKKGKFIINVPHYNSEKWLLKLRPTYFKEIHHVRVFRENELDHLLRQNSFKLLRKDKKGFLQHIELFFLFSRKINSKTQLSIGSWRDNYFTKSLHAVMLYFDPLVIHTPLIYFPIWIITLPIGYLINFFGNIYFPKSFYYEAVKI